LSLAEYKNHETSGNHGRPWPWNILGGGGDRAKFRGRQIRLAGAQFPAGIFTDLGIAESWIARHKLSGTLTLYRVDEGAYDWSIRNDFFKPYKPNHFQPEFIGRFSGGQQHHHYESGQRKT